MSMRRTLAAAVMFAQLGGGSSGGTGPVSPSVMATDMCTMSEPGKGTLELLVLWRGSPGWWRQRDGAASGGGGSGAGGTMGAGGSPMVRSAWVSQGGVNLSVRFDPVSRVAWIQDKELPLQDANVVLVDGVDSAAGPQIIRTLRIDPDFDTAIDLPPAMLRARPSGAPRPGTVPTQAFIRRSQELVEFLQCGMLVPGLSPDEQQAIDIWCAWSLEP
jgi:hypothetical protein